jgi:hypothetical protein
MEMKYMTEAVFSKIREPGRGFRSRVILISMVLALFVSLLLPSKAMAQSINLSDTSGMPGTSITVSGSGFTNGDTYSIVFAPGTYYESILITAGTITGTSFSQPVIIPSVPWGQYLIQVVTSKGTFSPYFTVLPFSGISQVSGSVGDTVVLSGVGFRANMQVTVLFDNTEIASRQTNSFGSFSGLSFAIPATRRGSHTIRVTDGIASTNHNFIIEPALTISPQTGVVDEQVTLRGTGFTANSPISIFWEGNVVSTGTITTNSNGSFTYTNFIIPASPQGANTIRARDGISASADASFIVSPKISLSQSSGGPGDLIEVVGKGFESNRSIALTFRGISVSIGAVATDTVGTFTTSFTVPGVAAGSYTVRAADGFNDATAVFSIVASLNLSPTSGYVGSEITISGDGFTPDGRVSILYDTTQVLTVSVNNFGSFSVSFTVPVSKGGPHPVTASDLTTPGVSASGTFSMETTPPSAPSLLQPEFNTQASVMPLFEWTEVTDPSGVIYQLQVARDSAFSRIVLSKQNLTESHYQLTQGEQLDLTKSDNPYYWRVRASDRADNIGQWSNPASFYTEDSTSPETPVLLRPQYGSSVSGETYFDWTDVTDPSGVTYQLQVAVDVDFTNLVIVKQGITLSEYTVTKAEKLQNTSGDSPYYWRVRAVDGAGNAGNWTSPGAFHVGLIRGWLLYVILGISGLVILLIGIFIGVRVVARKSTSTED